MAIDIFVCEGKIEFDELKDELTLKGPIATVVSSGFAYDNEHESYMRAIADLKTKIRASNGNFVYIKSKQVLKEPGDIFGPDEIGSYNYTTNLKGWIYLNND